MKISKLYKKLLFSIGWFEGEFPCFIECEVATGNSEMFTFFHIRVVKFVIGFYFFK